MNSVKIHTPIKFLSLFVVISFLLPAIKLGGFGMKLDLIFLMPLLLIVLMVDSKIKKEPLIRKLSFVTFLIFVVMLLSDTFGLLNFNFGEGIYFPTEFIQVFARVGTFYCFYYIAFEKIYKEENFLNILRYVFFIALIFGVLQSLHIGVIDSISSHYALTDVQVKGFESVEQRGYGVSGNIISWGGISGFLFFFFYFIVRKSLFKIIGIVLSLVNLSFSASRSAIISLIVTFLIIKFIEVILITKNFKVFFKFLTTITIIPIFGFYIFQNYFFDRYELMIKRFSNFDEALNETGRGAQREFFIDFMNQDFANYFIGIGKPALDRLGYMEMEPIFFIVAYGIVGTLLHYSLLYFIFRKFYSLRSINSKIFLFVLSSMMFFLIFSIGFFFFRETYSGLPFWIITGYLLGYVEKQSLYEK